MKYNKFLVCGGAGFVGSHLVDSLLSNGAEKVVVVDNMHLGTLENLHQSFKTKRVILYREDARYLTALENIIDLEKPEVIFNLAVKCLPYGFIDPEGSFMTGVEIAQNLADLLRQKKYKKLIHFSSSEAYGSAKTLGCMGEDHPLDPTTPYGAGKASADLLLISYHKLFNLNISILRPFNLYGPRQNMELYAAVIPMTINNILYGKNPVIEGDGNQTRDFTYVKDVTDFAVKLVDSDKIVGRVINLGQGTELSINDLMCLICKIMELPIQEIEYKPPRPSDVERLFADISLAKKLLDYNPKTSLETGLILTKRWLENRKDKQVHFCDSLRFVERY